MKRTIILLLLFCNFILFSDSYFNTLDYINMSNEPVTFNPEQNIYTDGIRLQLFSDYGKIFYLVNKSLLEAEPVEYKNVIFLKGEKDRVVDYDVIVMLERDNGIIEFYSRTYRIDRTEQVKKYEFPDNSKYRKNVLQDSDRINIEYVFNDANYNVTNEERRFIFPVNIQKQNENKKNITINSNPGEKLVMLTGVTYEKDNKLYTEIQNHTIDRETVKPPSFGSLYWGQYYRQSYKIKIKPFDKDDTVYYWFREWENEDYIFGPPATDKSDAWTLYKDPIELVSKFGKEGTFGIAGYSLGKNGEKSRISGPFYFKIDGVDRVFEQVFNDASNDAGVKRITLNGESYNGKIKNLDYDCTLKFGNSGSDIFYFTFKSEEYEGKSELFPCDGEYYFNNTGIYPVEFNLFRSNGEKIGEFNITPKGMLLPVMKKYRAQFVDVSSDEVISFYLPKNSIRYEVTTNQNKNLNVTKNSGIFTGKFKLNAPTGEETTFKIRFGSFDEKDNLLTESGYYFLKIDRKAASVDVSADGVDFSIYHNEQQKLKLTVPDKDSRIFYRLKTEGEWLLYDKPLLFNPPLTGLYEVKIYTRTTDKAGNIRENKDPFVIKFDRRGIFVNSSQKFSGNGTESSPFNSIERAVYFAKLRNLKIIYLVSDEYSISVPVNIETDIIIQPLSTDKKTVINLDTKSIWKKQHIWFDINKNGYLEMRNLLINIKSGYLFANMNANKLKIYNSDFEFSGKNSFVFIKNNGGKIGINNIAFNSTDEADSFSFIDSNSGNVILKNIKTKFYAKNANVFNFIDSRNISIDYLTLDLTADQSVKFMTVKGSTVDAKKIIFKQKGTFGKTDLFSLQKTTLNLDESDFIIDGVNPFETSLLDQHSSKTQINKSLFRIKKTFSSIAFNSTDSDLVFEQSMLDIQNVKDYVYDFRLDRSLLKAKSSIIRNLKSFSTVNFVLNNSIYEGANNSVFNVSNVKKAFAFWINDKATLSTVNSLYYFTDQTSDTSGKLKEPDTFIFANNKDYSSLKPLWYSNSISSNTVIMENLDKKDSTEILNDFNDKNIFYLFDKDFNVENDDFFIPLKDSPLLQGGLDDTKSPVSIPELDFLGKVRIISGIGIDIGAIQKTGNF